MDKKFSRVVVFVVASAFACMSLSPKAMANGRFPLARIITAPLGGDGKTLYLRTTFGLLRSKDAGKHFRWICEEAMGFSGSWDPPVAVTRDERVFVGLERGLKVSRGGCNFEVVPELDGELVADLSLEADRKRVIVVTGTRGKVPAIFRETSPGHLTRVGEGPMGITFDTVDVAPSRPSRLYATGIDYTKKPWAHLFRSDDGGKTIVDITPALPEDGTLFLSAIDPKNPDRVYVREIRARDGGTELLVSDDGGKTLRSTLSRPTPLYGFAMEDDGKTLYAAAGDPAEGLYRSDDRGEHWRSVQRVGLKCLFWGNGALYGCSNETVRGGYAIAGLPQRGEKFAPLGTFFEVEGPLACDGGASPCSAGWAKARKQMLPIPPDASVDDDDEPDATAPISSSPPDAGACEPIRGPDAGGACGDGPAATASSSASQKPSTGGSQCGCNTAPEPTILGALSLFVLTLRRRKAGSNRVHGGGHRPGVRGTTITHESA